MAEDWAVNVRKYAPEADPDIIAGIIRHCGIALQSRDASLVSFSDAAETGRVRESFLKKKLGLMEADEQLDNSIAAVGERMKDEHFRHRVTVYYLLADHYGKLENFRKPAAHTAASHAAGARIVEPQGGEAPRPAEARTAEPFAAAASEAPDPADTAKASVAGVGNFGAVGLAAGAAYLGAGSAAIKGASGVGSYDGGSASSATSSVGGGAAQAFVSGSTVDEPVTRSGLSHWLPWLVPVFAIVLLLLYLSGYRI